MGNIIYIWIAHDKGEVDDKVYALINEAREFFKKGKPQPPIIGLIFGSDLMDVVKNLGDKGLDRLIICDDESLLNYHGERYTQLLTGILKEAPLECLLMVDSPISADLAPRVAASLEIAIVNRIVNFSVDTNGDKTFVRPLANGLLSEEIFIRACSPFIASFLPSILGDWESNEEKKLELDVRQVALWNLTSQTRWIEFQSADPGDVDLEDAEVIIAGGRGVGIDGFDIVYQLADCLGGSVGATRPLVDWNLIPFDYQIGQTGKAVSPELIINCGISGANEYTIGMEKSRRVIAINNDSRSRIFEFADLGVVGDVHEILPLLIDRLRKLKKNNL